MVWIINELHILLCSVWTGCVVYGIYAIFQLVRQIVRHKDWMVALEDFVFWIFTSFYIFSQVFIANAGELKWYIFIGLVVGAWSAHTIWYDVKKLVLLIKKKLEKPT